MTTTQPHAKVREAAQEIEEIVQNYTLGWGEGYDADPEPTVCALSELLESKLQYGRLVGELKALRSIVMAVRQFAPTNGFCMPGFGGRTADEHCFEVERLLRDLGEL